MSAPKEIPLRVVPSSSTSSAFDVVDSNGSSLGTPVIVKRRDSLVGGVIGAGTRSIYVRKKKIEREGGRERSSFFTAVVKEERRRG